MPLGTRLDAGPIARVGAKPSVNAWVNELIEQALEAREVDWNEHFDRPSSGRRFRLTGKVERRER
ncbi:MAG: hypothetical protein ACLQVX_24390 [Limisphaerales bacterium]